ncbi:MAG: amino acid transporter [Geodermatophilaceae bacterium]|nr:amino acid transporter [Geodermatophilaceae bacterium]
MTTATEVLAVLDALAGAGCRAWVAGGWGVDALAGRQTRTHRDLDLAVDSAGEAVALETLHGLGYRIEIDWRPVRLELACDRGRVDVHPVRFDATGRGTQAGLDGAVFVYPEDCFVSGTIDGRLVGCLSVEQQLAFHRGYEPSAVDLADLALLETLSC